MKKLLLLLCSAFYFVAFGQSEKSVYLKIGSNITKYEYVGRNVDLFSEAGGSYEIGYKSMILNASQPGLYYTLGVVVDHFNQKGGSDTSLYQWESTYLGLNGNLGFWVARSNADRFVANLFMGMSVNMMLNGTQITNNKLYNLKNNSEFDKLYIQPRLGLEGVYRINEDFALSLGYQLSKTFNFQSNKEENLNFINHTFFVGASIDL